LKSYGKTDLEEKATFATTDHQLSLIRSEISNRVLRKNIFEQKKPVGNPVLHHHVRKRDSSFARMNLN
jgi:hypothetical protein